MSQNSNDLTEARDLIMDIANDAPSPDEISEYRKKVSKGEANRQFLYDSVKLDLLLIHDEIATLAKAYGFIIDDQEDRIKLLQDQMRGMSALVTCISEMIIFNEREKKKCQLNPSVN